MKTTIITLSVFLQLFCISVFAGVNIQEVQFEEANKKAQNRFSKLTSLRPNDDIRLIKFRITQSKFSQISLLDGQDGVYQTQEKRKVKRGTRINAISNNDDVLSVTVKNKSIRGHFSLNNVIYDLEKIGGGYYFMIERPALKGSNEKDYALLPPVESLEQIERRKCEDPNECDWPPIGGGVVTTVPYTTRVLFVFTNDAAEANYDDVTVMANKAQIAIDNMNDHLEDSLVDDYMTVEYAGIYQWDHDETRHYYVECGIGWVTAKEPINGIPGIAKTDPAVQAERNRVAADIVVVISNVNDGQIAGFAEQIAASSENAYAVVDSAYINTHIFSHEVGHLIGMRHDIDQDNKLKPYKYGHGFVNWYIARRTIMAYDCDGPVSCLTVVGIFSNPEVNFPGTSFPTGTNNNTGTCYGSSFPWVGHCKANNAKVVIDRAFTVSTFR